MFLEERTVDARGQIIFREVSYQTSLRPFSRVLVQPSPEGVLLYRQDGQTESQIPCELHGGIFA